MREIIALTREAVHAGKKRVLSCSENFGYAATQVSSVTLWPRLSRRLT